MITPNGLVLPDYASVADSYTDIVNGGTVAAGQPFTVLAQGAYIDRIVSVFALFTTSAAAGVRQVRLIIQNNQGVSVTEVPAPSGQNPSESRIYGFLNSISAAYSTAGSINWHFAPCPSVLAYPSFSYGLTAQGLLAGDQFTGVQLVRERYPTGASYPDEEIQPFATPLVT